VTVPAIDAQQVSKRFVLRHNRDASLKVRFLGLWHKGQREEREDFWAVRDVSLSVARGESLALVGRNGSGKSTFLKLVAGIHRPTSGRLLVGANARVGSMIELGIGFHPDLSGTENVYLNAAIHGLTRAQIDDIYPRVVEYSGLSHFMDVPLKNFSSGMHMRLGFAIVANLDPDILLLDEIFAVGDEDFQKQCMKTMEQFAAEGRTLLFVSHATASVRAICRRVCLLDHGRLLFDGGVEEGLAEYQGLIAAARPSAVARRSAAAGDGEAEDADVGKDWEDRTGAWALDLLAREGLQPHHRVLEITCGTVSGSSSLAGYVGPARYQHWEIGTPLSEPLRPFDYLLASPLLSRVSLNAGVRSLAYALRVMPPNARIYTAWIDHDDAIDVGDTPPFTYPFNLVCAVIETLGLRATRVPDAKHPAGESLLVFERPDRA
jgi:ABC-type polysaccharide/polyol phosphate transport system ATPase subunit